jgi:predicted Zn-dependent peptidase
MLRTALIVLAWLLSAIPAAADVRFVTRTLPNGLTVVLAPEVAGEVVAIHATFDATALDPTGLRAPGFRADSNSQRSLLATEVATTDVPKALQALAAALVARRDRAASMVIALAGTFDERTMLAAVNAILGTLPAGPPRERCKPVAVLLRRERRREVIDETAKQTEISLSYPTAVSSSRDWLALNILADVLGQGPASRFQTRLVATGLAIDVAEGETESPCTASPLRIRVRVTPGVAVAEVQAAIDREIARFADELVTDGELHTAHDQERNWSAEQLSTPAGIASAAARSVLFYGRAEHTYDEAAGMHAVTAEDVRNVARKYLRPSNREVIIKRPPV